MQSAVNVDRASKKVAKDLITPLTEQLHSIASASGWPEYIISSLNVDLDEHFNLHINYPESLKNEIDNLEYGAEFGLPNAVIRPFISRAPDLIEKALEKLTVSDLFPELGVI